jgi:glycosyltransferase involved in cell wall biosynthesis
MPIQIVIVGEGPLVDEIRSHPGVMGTDKLIGRIVYFKGPMYKISEINQLYNYADIVLGNGRGILEAMACGKPVVIVNEIGAGEAVCHENIKDVAFFNFSGRHIRNDGQSHGSLHTVLRALIDDGDMRKRFGQYLYVYIKQNMDAEIGAKQLLGVYERSLYKPLRIIDLISWNLKVTYTILGLAVQRRVRRLKQKGTQS